MEEALFSMFFGLQTKNDVTSGDHFCWNQRFQGCWRRGNL